MSEFMESPATVDSVEAANDLEPGEQPKTPTNMCLVYQITFAGVWVNVVGSLNANGTIILFDDMGWSKFRLGLLTTFSILGIVVGTACALLLTEIFAIPPLMVMGILNLVAVLGRILLAVALFHALYYELVLCAAFLGGIASWSVISDPIVDYFTDQTLRTTTFNIIFALRAVANVAIMAITFLFLDNMHCLKIITVVSVFLQFALTVFFFCINGPSTMPGANMTDEFCAKFTLLFSLTRFALIFAISLFLGVFSSLGIYIFLWVREEYGWSKIEMQVWFMVTVAPSVLLGLLASSYYFDSEIERSGMSRYEIFAFIARTARNMIFVLVIALNFMIRFGPIVFLLCLSLLTFVLSFLPSTLLLLNSVPLHIAHFAVTGALIGGLLVSALATPLNGWLITKFGHNLTFTIILNSQFIVVLLFHLASTVQENDQEPEEILQN